MQQLYELFAPNLLGSAVIKKYKAGDQFLLPGKAALVLEGVIAVDGIVEERGIALTLRLAKEGDVLNIEEVVGQTALEQQYCCETPICVIAIVSCEYFQNQLNSTSPVVKNAISQVLLSKVFQNYNEVMTTLSGVSIGTSKEQTLWALRRYQEVTRSIGELPLRKGRLATHIGSTPESISRALRALAEEGLIELTQRSLRLIEA